MDKDPSQDYTPESQVEFLVNSTFEECRANIDLYDSPSGIWINIGGVAWAVTYWPAYDDKPDSLIITRGVVEYAEPVSYCFNHNGTVSKNDTVERRIPGGVYFDESATKTVDDVDEIDVLKAIVIAAHREKAQ